MPKYPELAERTNQITGSVYEKFRKKMAAQGDNLVALHIGDAYAPPPYEIPFDRDFLSAHPGFHRYCDTFGIAPLRDAIAEKVSADNTLPATAENVLVTCGATNALSVAVQTLVDPGDDVMVLSPYWPFFRGMVVMAGAKPVEVPLYVRLYEEPDLDVGAYLESRLTATTVAVYINSPNNPSGKVLSKSQMDSVADFVRRNDLWLISDEAYDGMTFDDNVHYSPGSFPGMFERTLSIYTFSKVYMFSGLRLGYTVSAPDVVRALNKTMVHQLYSPSTVAQQMMVAPIRARASWHRRFVEECQGLRDTFVDGLEIAPPRPDGAYYLFFPVDDYLNGRAYGDLINGCLDAGVSIAPGADFGRDYANFVRICFAGEPPRRLELAIERLNRVFSEKV